MAEWLAQITPDTSYQEMMERPSAFNPEPEQVDSDLEITRLGTLASRDENTRYCIRYSNDTVYDIEWPLHHPIKQDEAKTRPIDPDSETLDPWTQAAIKDFERFDSFWEVQASALAHNRLLGDGRAIFDKTFTLALRKGLFQDPSGFIKYASKAFERSLQHDMPAAAFAIAKTAFDGEMTVRGKMQRCNGLRYWLDENVTHVIEPGISQALRSAQAAHVSPESKDLKRLDRIRRAMATQAISLAQTSWIMRSLKAADEHYAQKNPALAEKIVWHQIMTGGQAIIAAKNLAESLNAIPEKERATTSLRLEGQTPQQIGSYILDILN